MLQTQVLTIRQAKNTEHLHLTEFDMPKIPPNFKAVGDAQSASIDVRTPVEGIVYRSSTPLCAQIQAHLRYYHQTKNGDYINRDEGTQTEPRMMAMPRFLTWAMAFSIRTSG